MMRKLVVLLFLIGSFAACHKTESHRLSDGRWRGSLDVSGLEFPFIFEVEHASTDSAAVYLINGNERFELRGISCSGDSVVIPIDAYDAVLSGVVKDNEFCGTFKRLYRENDEGIYFCSKKTDAPRFAVSSVTTPFSPAGKWDIQFIGLDGDTTLNVGVFNVADGIVTGSILKKTGDFRYLEGGLTVDGFQLSAFSGMSPYLLYARFMNEDEFIGEFHMVTAPFKVIGKRNTEARPEDPYSLTYMKEGYDRLDFTFPNKEGENISLSDERYKDKVVIVSILGSWCPNCLDEMEYLSAWYRKNNKRGIEIVGVAFERKNDEEYVRTVLSRLIDRYGVDYEILFGGELNAESTEKAFPQISKVMAYPTTIFIDKQGRVRKIHTGFNGPATGVFFEEFKQDFNFIVDSLLEEQV